MTNPENLQPIPITTHLIFTEETFYPEKCRFEDYWDRWGLNYSSPYLLAGKPTLFNATLGFDDDNKLRFISHHIDAVYRKAMIEDIRQSIKNGKIKPLEPPKQ